MTMDRKEFVLTCGKSCLGLIGLSLLTEGCAGTKYFSAPLEGSHLVIPLTTFISEKEGSPQFLRYIVVENPKLEYPICVYRDSAASFQALLMRCTHQGTELQVFGDRLQCPAHGSEFTNKGDVANGPADTALRTFPVTVRSEQLLIDLS